MNEKTNDPEDPRPGPGTDSPAAAAPIVTVDGGEPGPGDDAPAGEDDAPGPEDAAPAPGDDARGPEDAAPGPGNDAPPPAPARRGIGPVALLALLLAAVSLAATGYLWWASRDSGSTAAGNAADIERLAGALEDVQGSLGGLRERVGELDSAGAARARDLAALESQLAQTGDRLASVPGRLSSLESAVAALQGISAGARDAWLLAEAEYYLQIANAQLQLAGNPERALLALRFADQRIRQLADPGLAAVRRALASELRAVEAMERPDVQGISMTLASLSETVESLPLASDAPGRAGAAGGPPADASGWSRALASVKAAFSDIVTVRRADEELTPLMSPDAAYFLRTNLALKLQTARLALLRGEQAVFEQDLADAAAWLRDYYATDSRAVQSALKTLSGLRDAEFTVTTPDISESLRLLREFQQRHAAGAREAPADEPAQ